MTQIPEMNYAIVRSDGAAYNGRANDTIESLFTRIPMNIFTYTAAAAARKIAGTPAFADCIALHVYSGQTLAARAKDYAYERAVRRLEREGMTRSDAQGAVDAEWLKRAAKQERTS